MIYAPNYYPAFRCIASACRHSCCIGWEIDIDADTRTAYAAVEGEFGARLSAAIEDGEDGARFRLCTGERCPMLREDGLCDLILTLGEGALCQICADHPRFRSFFSGRTEIGLGLCCEAACALILGQREPMQLIVLADDGDDAPLGEDERDLLTLRDALLAIAGDDALSLDARIAAIRAQAGAATDRRSMAEWQRIYRGLERLEPAWADALDRLGIATASLDAAWDAPLARLLAYLLYRHLPGALDDGRRTARVGFALLGVRVVRAIFAAGEHTMARLCEIARMYSSEIEYDEDNVAALLDALEEM